MEEGKHSLRPEHKWSSRGPGQPLSKRQQTGEAGEGVNQSNRPSPLLTGRPLPQEAQGQKVSWS